MVLWCGLGVLCGKVHPAAQELTKQEVSFDAGCVNMGVMYKEYGQKLTSGWW